MSSADSKRIQPAHGDSMRIVPLHLPDDVRQPTAEAHAARAAKAPHLTYRGGPLLGAVKVVTVFWGPAWEGAQAPLVAQLNGFFDFVLKSALLDQLAEYSVPGRPIGHGSRIATVTLPAPPPHVVSDSTLQHTLQQQIIGHPGVPGPDGETLYFVYLPPGVRSVQGGSSSCQGFCGYHSDIVGNVFYAVMPFPGCSGCTGGLSTLAALTSTSSHELCEAITDPIPGQGWYDDVHGEIGDICAWKTKQLGAYTVQLEWSNQAGKCL